MPKKLSFEEFQNKFKNELGNEYDLLSKKYINCKTKIKVKHNKCGNEYEVTPDMILGKKKRRCPFCSGKLLKNTDIFKKEVYDLVGKEYTVLGEYKNADTKILMKHNKCGNEYEVTPNNFLNQKRRCPFCSGNKKKTTDIFKKEVYDLVGKEYTVLGEYKNADTKILMKHNKCGNEYEVTPNKFLQDRRCPKCRFSRGEEIIRNYLKKNNISFQEQFSFPDCKYKRVLRFDFKLDINNKIILLEYDGEFHFNNKYSKKNLEEQKIRDNIKNEYCKNKNIPLIRFTNLNKDELLKKLDNVFNDYRNL